MPLYTKFGDAGQTMLYGGKRVSKTDPRVHAYGTVDELDALLGVLLAESCSVELREQLETIQHHLYIVKSDLATPHSFKGTAKRITLEHVRILEQWIDVLEKKVPLPQHFVLPGGTPVGALLHYTRTVCRRAERWVVTLSGTEQVNSLCLQYLNRLGDFFFAASRVVNAEGGVEEIKA